METEARCICLQTEIAGERAARRELVHDLGQRAGGLPGLDLLESSNRTHKERLNVLMSKRLNVKKNRRNVRGTVSTSQRRERASERRKERRKVGTSQRQEKRRNDGFSERPTCLPDIDDGRPSDAGN